MRCTIKLFSIALAGLLASSGAIAHADNTYDIATTKSYFGTVSGTITGTGSTVTGFDITASGNSNPYIFDSSAAGSSVSILSLDTLQDGTPVDLVTLLNASNQQFSINFTGNFTSGLSYVSGEDAYLRGQHVGTFGDAGTLDQMGNPVTSDDISLTLQNPASPVPEPSSLILMSTGLIAFCGTLGRRLRT